jgi:4-amino-4-deoxy-L-arabinose transferase-like glycosyltransferase
MTNRVNHANAISRSLGRQADASATATWAQPAVELIGVVLLLALAVLTATWFSRPTLRISAAEAAASHYLSGFWDVEHTGADSFRWSQADATIRLFGLEQRAPVLFQARLSASRPPGAPEAQLTIDSGAAPIRFQIRREWRRYMTLLPAPARGAEGSAIELHSLVEPPHDDSRDLGVALDWFAATSQPRTPLDRMPDGGRLAFLLAIGLLSYVAIRRTGVPMPSALLLVLAAAAALGIGILAAPSAVAYWLPNLWLIALAGWLALLLPSIVAWLRQQRWRFTHVAALIAVGTGVILLPLQQPWTSAAGWLLLLSGSIVLAAALPAFPAAESTPLSPRSVALALSAITLLALALRLPGLDTLPLGMWRDEARHGLLALRILHDPSYRPVYVPNIADIPALLFYLAAVPIGLFGAHPWTIRLIPALAGALMPLALYFASRPLFGTRAGLLAAALLAISVWQISLSRLAFAATLGPPLTLLAIGLVWRAFATEDDGRKTKDNRQSRHRRSSFVFRLLPVAPAFLLSRHALAAALAGGVTGLAIYAYHPSRLTPLVVAIAIALRLGWNTRAWRAAAPRLALLALAAALVAWPLIDYGLDHRASFSQRIGQTSIFNSDSLAGRAPLARVEENLRLNLGIWNERGDRIGRHNLPNAPMLDPLIGAAFAIGAGLVLLRLRDRRALFLALWMGVALVPGLFSIEAPHAVRTVEAIAPTMLVAAIGACVLITATNLSSFVLRPWSTFMLAGLLLAALALNSARYFIAWPKSPQAYEEFFVAETHAGEIIQRLAAQPAIHAGGYQIYVPASAASGDVLSYLTSGIALETFAHGRLATPAGDRALLIDIGGQMSDPQDIRRALGDGAALLGSGPISPLNGRPEWTIYGHGPAAAQAVAQALAP